MGDEQTGRVAAWSFGRLRPRGRGLYSHRVDTSHSGATGGPVGVFPSIQEARDDASSSRNRDIKDRFVSIGGKGFRCADTAAACGS